MCRMWWPLTLTYIFKVIWPWLWKSCLLCNVFSSRSIIFLTWDPIVWVIMRRRGVSSERRRSSCSSLICDIWTRCSVGFRIGMLSPARWLEMLQMAKKGVETIHFFQFWHKIGVQIRHFPHFYSNIGVETIQIIKRPEKGGSKCGAYR